MIHAKYYDIKVICSFCNTLPHATLSKNISGNKCDVCGKVNPIVTYETKGKEGKTR